MITVVLSSVIGRSEKVCHLYSVISLSERSLSRFFLFPIFLIDEIDLGQVYRVRDPKGQIETV